MAFSLAVTVPGSRLLGAVFHERLQGIALDPHGPADAGRLDLPGLDQRPERGSGEVRVGFCLLVVEPCGRYGYLLVLFGHDAPPFYDRRSRINEMGANSPRWQRETPGQAG